MSGSTNTYGQGGNTKSWCSQKDRHIAVFNEFRSKESLDEFEDMSASDMIDRKTHTEFVHYLVHTYKILTGRRKGKGYSTSTVLATARGIIHRAREHIEEKGTGTQASAHFFTCMDVNSHSESWNWWHRVTAQVTREFYLQKLYRGDTVDHSCKGIYPGDVATMCQKLEQEGTAQAMEDKFALTIAAQVRQHHRLPHVQ
jgi:hypothetical protein